MILQGFLEGHEEDITVMTKVQEFLVTGSRDKTLNVYDLRKMKKVGDIKEHEDIVWALNGYDGNVLSGDFNGAVHLWSVKNQKILQSMAPDTLPVRNLAHNAGTNQFIVGSKGNVAIYDNRKLDKEELISFDMKD